MMKKKSFLRNHKKKIIAISILGITMLLFMNWIGFKEVPGYIETFWVRHLKCKIDPELCEKENAEWERWKFLGDSLNKVIKNQNKIVDAVAGDFDGNGSIEYAFISPNSGYINFSKGDLPNLVDLGKLDSNYAKIFNEGDLNNDGADEFSVYLYGNGHNCIYTFMYEVPFPWREILKIELNSNEKSSDEDIKNRVFRKNNQIYYYDEEEIKSLSSSIIKVQYKLVRKKLKDYKTTKSNFKIEILR